MKFMRILPLVFVAGFALAAPEDQERRQGVYCVCVGFRVYERKLINATKVESVVNSVAGAVTSDGESLFIRCISYITI